jgi:hypothetical protein
MFPADWHNTDPVAHLTLWEEMRDSGVAANEVVRARAQEEEFRKLLEAAATMLMSPVGRVASHARFVQVQRKIAELAVAGALKTFVRPVPGGVAIKEAPADWWSIENQYLAARFALCRLDPNRPSSGRIESDDRYASYIFVSKDGLTHSLNALSQLPAKSARDAPSEELAPAEARRAKPAQKSPKIQSGGRPPILRNNVIAALREMFPDGVPRGHPQWTQDAIVAAVAERMGKGNNVSASTIKRAVAQLRAEQSKADGS